MWPSGMLIYEIFSTAKMETYNDETWLWKVLSITFVLNLWEVFFQGPWLLPLGNTICGQSVWVEKG